MRFGRKQPVALGPHLRLSNYLRASLPVIPANADYATLATLPSLRDVMGNDLLGDCVVASLNHVQGVLTGNAGELVHASLDEIISQYSKIGGYVVGDPSTDNGCDEISALNFICANGFANGAKPLGWIYVDGSNYAEVETAIYLFEHVIICAGLPDSWVATMPQADGYFWGADKPNLQNGHSFMAKGYTIGGASIDSWGLFGQLTPQALHDCCTTQTGGGVYCLLDPEMLTRGQSRAPNGVAWSDLVSDFDSMGGHVAPATPPPVVVTPPAPAGSAVSLAQATAWIDAALSAAHPLLTRSQAQAIVDAALSSNWSK